MDIQLSGKDIIDLVNVGIITKEEAQRLVLVNGGK